ncbi:hypothetical protein GALMADRAFT_450342 [Galerina marginata CBS 339.88]|uniref:Uncharacterized protein n=1 Tax=Galerina marginata (strain CBS 339.88) TaxID=685588 RepID=A0A067TC44_GALM3|nr:hypothetical protein GALMADRAFT_450342 [Galerina marginata CBS 339.88]
MATPFSWSDTIQIAFGSCLPCIKPSPSAGSEDDTHPDEIHDPAINRIPRARPDELQGLLADPDTDVDAETMSLHSNPGRSAAQRGKKRRRRMKKGSTSSSGGVGARSSRRITLFGYNLFGNPAIQLSDDGEDALYPDSRRNAPTTIFAANSTSTFDSDAAPLDADAINALSSPSGAAAAVEAAAQASAAAEAQRLREKEERRQKRREKKELKKLAEALARQASGDADGDGEFEGFQGSGANAAPALAKSGSGYPRIPNTMYPGRAASDSGSGSGFSGSTRDEFGQFVSAPPLPLAAGPYTPQHEEDDDAADLDGGLYARNAPRNGNGGGGSDSRSRTSASTSDRAHQFPDPRNVFRHIRSHSHSQSSSRVNSPSYAQLQFHTQPDTVATPDSERLHQQHTKKPKSKSKSTSKTSSSTGSNTRSSATTTSTSTSQSPSLPSPISPSFSALPHAPAVRVQENQIVSPSTVEQGQGFFDLEDEMPVRKAVGAGAGVVGPGPGPAVGVHGKATTEFPSARIGGGAGGGGFPMTGFGGGGQGGGVKRSRDFGAFLARRGDGDDEDGEGL